jgi:hypothetical protein
MQQRNRSSQPQCEYADRLERVANVLISRFSERMTPSQWEACHIALWSFYQELAVDLKERGRFHYSSPAGSLHCCLRQAYETAKATLDILQQTPAAPPPAPPRPQRRSLADVLKQFAEEREGNDTAPGTTGKSDFPTG